MPNCEQSRDSMNNNAGKFSSSKQPICSGLRTWRLAIAFFLGFAQALVMLDSFIPMRSRLVASDQTLAQVGLPWRLLVWPVAHFLIISALAYWPVIACWFRLPTGNTPAGMRWIWIKWAAAVVLYALSVLITIPALYAWS